MPERSDVLWGLLAVRVFSLTLLTAYLGGAIIAALFTTRQIREEGD